MKQLASFGVLAAVLVLPTAVIAQRPLGATPAMATQRAASVGPSGTGAQLHLSLHYDGKLLVKVFDMQVEQRATAVGHSSTARFQSYGVLAAFKRLDMAASSSGRMVGGDPKPGIFVSKNNASKTRRQVTVAWGRDDVAVRAAPTYLSLGEPPASRAQKLAAADPLTQLMRMTVNGAQGHLCNRTVRFFDGKQLYDLTFLAARPAPATGRERKLGLINSVRCDVRFQEVAGFKAKPQERRDQGLNHGVTLDFGQVGAGGPWVLSALRASTPLGRGSVELTSVTVTSRGPTS